MAYLGSGGFGDVYLCHDPVIGRRIAVKKLKRAFDQSSFSEVQIVSQINHPNVLGVFEADPARGLIIMEYISGGSLADRIEKDPAWVRTNYDKIFLSVLEGLRAAHRVKVVHRDIKPENILIGEDGVARVADFGVARVFDSTNDYTSSFRGTLPYMAPEVLAGLPYSYEADMHSLGCTMYEAWSGKQAYSTGGNLDSWIAIKAQPPTPLRDVSPIEVDDLLHEIIDRLLSIGTERLKRADSVSQLLRARTPRPDAGGIPSIDDLQYELGLIYTNANANKSELEILAKLQSSLRALSISSIRNDNKGRELARRHFALVFAWLCALATATNTRPSELIWLKFAGACPYCESKPCVCATSGSATASAKEGLLGKVQHRLAEDRPASQTVDQYSAMFGQIYGAVNRNVDISGIALRFFMEIAEASDAVLAMSHASDDNLEKSTILQLELSDLFAWFFALLNHWKGSDDFSLVDSFRETFANGCFYCSHSPCDCPAPKRILSWREA